MIDSIHSNTARRAEPRVAVAAPRCLLIAEPDTRWPELAETCRERGAEVAILLQHASEPEPVFARRLCTAVARAQLEDRPFDGAVVFVNDELAPHHEPARARLLQLLAQTLLRTAHPVTIHVDCSKAAAAPLHLSLERIQRAVARQFREFALLSVCIGSPSFGQARALATG
jgi:hypothetical protein